MNTENMIEITGVDLRALVRAAYDLSQPQGMGFLHAKDGPIPEEQVEKVIAKGEDYPRRPVSMDYVLGRAVKLTVFRDDDDRLWIYNRWYDHGDWQLTELLTQLGVDKAAVALVATPALPDRSFA